MVNLAETSRVPKDLQSRRTFTRHWIDRQEGLILLKDAGVSCIV
jgi:hypothetical protein